MGLFDAFKRNSDRKSFRSDVEKEMYEKNLFGYRDLKDGLDYEDRLLSRVHTALERYRKDGDIDSLIAEYEYVLIESNPPCHSVPPKKLVDLYIKAGKNDKAWGYLNSLILKFPDSVGWIRFEQARILKKEKRYLEALEMYCFGYLDKSKWNNTFQANMFLKDAKSSANKLGWSQEKLERLSKIIEKQVKRKDYTEQNMKRLFLTFASME